MNPKNQKVGWIGLWLAIVGLILPVMLGLIFAMNTDKIVVPLIFLFSAFEVAALGCGIVAWKTQPGKAAFTISAISLVLLALFVSFTVIVPVVS